MVLRSTNCILSAILHGVRVIRIMRMRTIAAGGTVVSLSHSFRVATLTVVVVITTIWETLT